MKNASEFIADWLVSMGIEQVFSVTGGGAMFLNQGLGAHPGLRCTFMHHEQACAMAAEGYARISGKPAVVMVTTGPGAINALNGVYGAFTDSIPMLILAGQIKRETCLDFHDLPGLRQLGDQEGPAVHMAKHICKMAEIIREPKDLEWMLPKALHEATKGRPGPVWLDIPLDIQQARDPLNISTLKTPSPATDEKRLTAACEEIVSRLRSAYRPLVLGGTGVRLAGVRDRVLSLIERYQIPYATAWTHDLIASDHPLFAGRPGTIGTRAGNFVLQAADFVLVLGSRLNIRQVSYNWHSFAKNAWLAQVDIDPAEFKKPTKVPSLAVEADLKDFLDCFEIALLHSARSDYAQWIKWCQSIGQRFESSLEHKQSPDKPLNPYIVVDTVFKTLRHDDIVVCGNASACILPFQIGKLTNSQRLFSNSGAASMGYDLPAAIGAAEAAQTKGQKRRVVCFAGDGSLQMNIQELQTLKTRGLNVVVVILNNSGYLSIWQTHENFFGRVVGATPASGIEFPDFVSVAGAYGIKSISIKTVQELNKIKALFSADGPMVIDISVDQRQEFAPRIKSRVDSDGRFITPELDDMFPFLPEAVLESVRAEASLGRSL